MIIDICNSPNVLEVMYIVNIVITIIKVIVPILLIVSLMIDYARAVSNSDSNQLEKAKKTTVSKIIAAILIFLVPSIVNLIVTTVAPGSEYDRCLANISKDTINSAYNETMEHYLETAESTEEYSDYIAASNYIIFVKDSGKKEEYQKRLKELKEKIDKKREDEKSSSGGKYSKVDFKSFKWTYYKAKSGPIKEYEEKCNPYAIYAPSDASSLGGVSLPLIIWLHGSGEISASESAFLNSGLLKVVKDWDSYKLAPIPAIIVAPQATPGWWGGYTSNYKTIYALVKYAKEKYNIDSNNIVLMGHSMGAHGVLELTLEMKDLKLAAAVTMSTQRKEYGGSEGKKVYSKLRMKGYGEFESHQKFYDWIGQSKNYTYYKGATHGKVPQMALTEDLNKDGISDLMYWLFKDDADTISRTSSNGGSTIIPTPDPITSHVSIDSVNKLIASAAKSGGLYTRSAVVNVATTLVNTLSSNNYHIPYQLGGMYHRGKDWGLNPGWGRLITSNNSSVLSGLDCRNFVNWTFKQAGLSLIRGYGYEGAINGKYGDTYTNFSDGRPGDVIDAAQHIMIIIKNDKSSSSYVVAQSIGNYGVQLKTYKYSDLQPQKVETGDIWYKAYNMDGVYSNTGLYCKEESAYRAYSGSCYIPKSEFPSYYGF